MVAGNKREHFEKRVTCFQSMVKHARGETMLPTSRKWTGKRWAHAARPVFKKTYPKVNRAKRAVEADHLASLLGTETKFLDRFLVNSSITAAADMTGLELDPATFTCLNSMVQGDTSNTREGRKITCLSLNIKGIVHVNRKIDQTVLTEATNVFVAVVQNQQTNNAATNSEDVFSNPGADSRTCTMPFLNLLQTSKFRVLATRSFVMPAVEAVWDGTNVELGGTEATFDIFVDLKSMPVLMSANTGNNSDIVDNSLHLIGCVSNTTSTPLISYHSRLRFRG